MSAVLTEKNNNRPFEIYPLTANLGAEIRGLDFSATITEEIFAAIYQAFLDYQLLLFRNQYVAPGRQVEFARHFGEVQIHVMNQYHANQHPELYFLSNLDENGKPSGKHPDKGTQAWHTDGSWMRRTGQATMLFAEQIPAHGGETHYCDTYGAYEALSEDWKQRLASLRAIHNLDFSRTRRHGEDPMTEEQKNKVPPVDHPIIRTHPETGRRCVFLGDHAETIQGMDYAEGRALVEEINAMIVRPELVYQHRWQPNDLMVWDNRCLMHRVTDYDTANEPRVIRRCTVLGDVPE